MPRILRVDSDRAAALACDRPKRPALRLLVSTLPVGDGVFVVSSRRGHESDPKQTAIGRIAEAVHFYPLSSRRFLEPTSERGFGKRIASVGAIHPNCQVN